MTVDRARRLPLVEEQFEQRRFSREEIGELIETATRLDQLKSEGEGLGVEELRQVAGELGISEEALQAALEERARAEQEQRLEREVEEQSAALAREEDTARRDKRRRQLNEWRSHLASYIGVIGGLTAFDWFPDGSLDWVWWPAAGWGIGMLIHTLTVLFGVEDQH